MAARKTAAQKAAEAAEREEYTRIPENPEEQENEQDDNLTDVVDDKGRRLTVQQLKNKLRNEAEREVLDAHRPEVISRTEVKYKAHNLKYVRRLSDEEKAAKAIEEYYVKFPNLRPQLEQQQAQQEKVQQLDRTGLYEAVDRAHANDPDLVQAAPGGALATFRAGDYEYTEEPDISEYADVEGE